MKSLIILIAFSVTAQAKVVRLDIPDGDITIVENDVLDAEQWIKDAWAGKLNNCKERMYKKEIKLSIEEGSAIPKGIDQVIQKHLARPDYKNRKQRDIEEFGSR